MKVARPETTSADDVMARFKREISLGAKVWHPNVIRFYDAGQTDDLCYLVMEYFPGKNLWDLYREIPATPTGVKEMAIQVCAALCEAHRQGVIHRDIKPRNILRNERGNIKLVDFGVAKSQECNAQTNLTSLGAIVGTPAYMAPEQVKSPSEVDHRIDIYALGAVMYFCLASRPPYVGKNACQVGSTIPRLSQIRLGIPPILETVVVRAMAADRNKRYQNAEEMAQALEQVRI